MQTNATPTMPRRLGSALLLAASVWAGPAAAQDAAPPPPADVTQGPLPGQAPRPPRPDRLEVPPPAELPTVTIPPPADLSGIPDAPAAELPARADAAATPGQAPAAPRGQIDATIRFAPKLDAPGEEATPLLDSVAQRLKEQPEDRLELRAYAAAVQERGADPRRLALMRARAVRTALAGRGIEPRRLIVFAQAAPAEGDANPDRVDLVFSR